MESSKEARRPARILIGFYPARKSEPRSRAMRDPQAAAIYAADKLVNTRELLANAPGLDGDKLDHYIKTLCLLSDTRPDLPLLRELSEEMAKLVDREVGLGIWSVRSELEADGADSHGSTHSAASRICHGENY